MPHGHAPTERHRRLDILCGVWRAEITMLDTGGRPGDTHVATDTYRWMDGGFFLLHEVDARMGDTHLVALEIIRADPAGPGYLTNSFDNTGNATDYVAELDDRTWTIVSRSDRFAGTFSPDHLILTGHWERLDDGAWIPWMNVTLSRTADA